MRGGPGMCSRSGWRGSAGRYFGGEMVSAGENFGGRWPSGFKAPPMVSVETLLSVAVVHLAAADLPGGLLKTFYVGVLGLEFMGADEGRILFRHQMREIVLVRDQRELGRLGLL